MPNRWHKAWVSRCPSRTWVLHCWRMTCWVKWLEMGLDKWQDPNKTKIDMAHSATFSLKKKIDEYWCLVKCPCQILIGKMTKLGEANFEEPWFLGNWDPMTPSLSNRWFIYYIEFVPRLLYFFEVNKTYIMRSVMGFTRLVELLLFIFVCIQFYHQEPIPRKPQLHTLGFPFFPILLINIDGHKTHRLVLATPLFYTGKVNGWIAWPCGYLNSQDTTMQDTGPFKLKQKKRNQTIW